jgi:hypothetical protein
LEQNMTDTELTIPERLRRLHRLYLAEAGAIAGDLGPLDGPHMSATGRLGRTTKRRTDDELAALAAIAAECGRTPEEIARIRAVLVDELRIAARHTVRLGIAQAAFRDAEKSGAYVPKSQLVEERRHVRHEADLAEHRAQRAIRAVIDILNGVTDADLAERKMRVAEPNG